MGQQRNGGEQTQFRIQRAPQVAVEYRMHPLHKQQPPVPTRVCAAQKEENLCLRGNTAEVNTARKGRNNVACDVAAQTGGPDGAS